MSDFEGKGREAKAREGKIDRVETRAREGKIDRVEARDSNKRKDFMN